MSEIRKQNREKRRRSQNLSRWLILGGLVVLVGSIILLKGQSRPPAPVATGGETAQVQLDQALEAGLPVLAFFHSNSCQSCIDMIAVVNQVYPEFQGEVTLVDVNVYDEQNLALLQTVGLRYIPTQIFYDRSGEAETVVGVMQPGELREALASISEGN